MRYKCSCGNDDSKGGIVKEGMFTCSICLAKKKVYKKEDILEPTIPPPVQIASVVWLEKENKKPKHQKGI